MTTRTLSKNTNKIINSMIIILCILNLGLCIKFFSLKNETGLFKLTVLDIGQGDSLLIKTPNNFYGLIDSGKGNRVLEELEEVMPFNYKTLDFIILTHPDADHIEGFVEILKSYRINTIFMNYDLKDNELTDEIKKTIKVLGLKNFGLNESNDFEIDGVSFDILWPKNLQQSFTIEDSNDSSIAIKVKYKELDIYTAGDLSSSFEIKSLENDRELDIDVLKVSHHGSNSSTSSAFLSKVKPEISIISAGLNNSYGHPSEEVISNLNNIESIVFNTGRDGRINLVSDGISIKIETLAGRQYETTLY